MANIIQGGDLMLFVGGKSIAFATNHSLSVNAETSDITHKDIKGGWTATDVKTLSWEVTTENLYSNDGEGATFGDLYDYMVAKTPITGVFAVNTTAAVDGKVPTGGWTAPSTGEYYSGKVIITSLQANAPSGDNATFTCNFKGVGELKHNK